MKLSPEDKADFRSADLTQPHEVNIANTCKTHDFGL